MEKRIFSLLLSLAMLLAPALPQGAGAAEIPAPEGAGTEYVPGEVIVVFKESVGALKAASVIDSSDAEGAETLDISAGGITELVELPPDISVEDAIEEFERDPNVAYAQPNYIYTLADYEVSAVPNDPNYGSAQAKQWYLDNIDADEAWGLLSSGKTAVRVAVIDTLAQIAHEDLAGNVDTAAARDFSSGLESKTYPAPPSNTSHGTHVMGIVGAVSNNSKGIAGVATGGNNNVVKIIPVNVFSGESATTAAVTKAIRYSVSAGAKVINLSLGIYNKTDTSMGSAITDAVNSGVVVVCAGGNNAYTIPYTNYPSHDSNVIGVVNTNIANNRDSTSNYSENDNYISAPGTYILSTIPTNAYAYGTGTSMAAPVVSGVVAMMLYENPELTPAKVLEILKTKSKNPDVKTEIGGRRIDADDAVTAAKALLPAQPLAGKVTISGTAKYNETLSATAAITSNDPGTLSYTWKRDNTAISGAANATYKLTDSDIGHKISVAVTADNYSGTIESAQTNAIEKADAPSITWPTVSSAVVYGKKLSEITLTGDSADYGTFAWKNPDTVPDADTVSCPVVFTPSQTTTAHYEQITQTEKNVSVTINKAAAPSGVNQSVSIVKGNTLDFPLASLLPSVSGLSGMVYSASELSDNILTVGAIAVNGTLPLAVSDNATDGQSATVAVTISSKNHADFTATITVTAKNKTAVTITGLSASGGAYEIGKTHNGYAGTAIFNASGSIVTPDTTDLTAAYTGTTATGIPYTSTTAPPTDAGSYTVTLTLANDSTYYGQWIGNFTIDKAAPIYTVPANLTAEYGETLDAVTSLPGGFAWNDALTTSVGDVGSNRFPATFTPSGTANYNTDNNVQIPVSVTKKALNFSESSSAVTAVNKVYDGTASAALQIIGTLAGVLPEDDGKVGFTVSAAVSDKNVGTYKPVTASLALTGDKAGNYSPPTLPNNLTMDIVKKQITADDITITSPGKTYDGTAAASFTAAFKSGVIVGGDSVTLTLTGTYSDKETGSNKTITITGWSLSGAGAGNYALTGDPPATTTGSITASGGGSSSGGSGGGGSSSDESKTTPSTDGAVSVSYTQSGGSVTVSLTDSKVTEIISKSDGAAAIDLSKASNATSASLPVAAIEKLADAELAVELRLPQGTITLEAGAAKSLAEQAGGSSVSVGLKSVAGSALNERQQAAVGDAPVFDITASSGGGAITSFGGGSVRVTLPYTLKSGQRAEGVVALYVDAAGNTEALPTEYDAGAKKLTFTTSHLSLYAVGYDESLIPAPWVNPFLDVKASDWFCGDVEYAHVSGLMTGVSSSEFDPQGLVTRAMFVTILYRYAGSPAVSGGTGFSDVPAGQWYSSAVAWAAANGIVNGTGGGYFAPEEYVTREAAAAIFLRCAEYAGAGPRGAWAARLDFADIGDISDWATEGAMYCYINGIITGKPGGLFDPGGAATRAESAAMLRRFIEAVD
ncbi:MAG: S8 family serine peptidase [Oscillospiraceae bacterium]|jgi:hypothetical protein|nr:S8 family serine peptidase [Oscillospiraceae bacterium]